MKHLKPFNESKSNRKRLSVEDIEDYFLKFIDDGSMEFYYSGIAIGQKEIHTTFKLNNKFANIQTIQELQEFTHLVNQIGETCKRWNLKFKFSTFVSGSKPVEVVLHKHNYLLFKQCLLYQ
jgi:hypothetical protein